jgi:hypothetical protein
VGFCVLYQALVRDGFRCIVTGKYDMASDISHVDKNAVREAGVVNTECAHIVPESTYVDVSNTPTSPPHKVHKLIFLILLELTLAQKDCAASVLAVLYRFGYNFDNLNGPKVHSLFNVMTLDRNVHDWFDRLQVWFEKTVSVAFIPCSLSN